MASLKSSRADEFVAELRKLGEEVAGKVADAMVEAGAEEVKKAWKATAEAHGFRKTGQMIDSIDTAAKKKGQTNNIYRDIYPQGKDTKTGVRNAEKAYILHYGTSTKIKASYWVDEADAAAEGPMTEAMARVFDDYIQNH